MTIDASGRETSRAPVAGGGIGNMVRYAPPPPDPNAPARGRGAGRGAARGPRRSLPAQPGRRRRRATRARRRGRRPAQRARWRRRRAGGLPAGGARPVAAADQSFTANDWNDIGVIADVNTAAQADERRRGRHRRPST